MNPSPSSSLPPSPVAPAPSRTRRNLLILVLLAVSLGVVGWYVYDATTHESTDDAYISGHVHEVSSRISGAVKEVLFDDNQTVQAGEVLVRLDPADNQAALQEASANFEKAKLDDQRNQELVGTKAVSQQDLDHARSDLQAAQARLETARLQAGYTTIVAPASGLAGHRNVEVGNRVQPGETLLAVVEPDVWVVANFKETQLPRIHAGLPVTITVDALPGKTFQGTVDSIAPASGNVFALLPADNSTGNFTKIVQRIPVKIRFNPDSLHGLESRIRAGMSAVVSIQF